MGKTHPRTWQGSAQSWARAVCLQNQNLCSACSVLPPGQEWMGGRELLLGLGHSVLVVLHWNWVLRRRTLRARWWVSFWPGQICGPRGPPGGPVCLPTWRSRERSKLNIQLRVTNILKRETCNRLPHTQDRVVLCCDMGLLAPQLSYKLPKEKAAFSNSWASVIWKRELELPVLGKM